MVERSTVNRLVVGSSPTWGVYNMDANRKYIYKKIMFTALNRMGWRMLYSLGNLQLAILLLLTIAMASSLGTFIEQDKSVLFYETNYPIDKPIFGFIASDFILFLGLNQVYTTPWFMFLLIAFGGSLFSCTLTRQLPALKLARLWQFFKVDQRPKKVGMTFKIDNVSLSKFTYLLRERDYNVIQQGPYIYGYKGLVGKVGPILVHASIIFILMGSIIGSLTGFMVQEIIPKGELYHLQNIVTSGPLSSVRQDFEIYINEFKIAYSEQGVVDQFYSDLSILNNNLKVSSRKTIFVNEPLRYSGITFYQTDWGITTAQIMFNSENLQDIPLQEISIQNGSRFWIGNLFTGEKDRVLLVLEDLTGKCLFYDSEKKFLGETQVGHKVFFSGGEIRVTKIVPATGLQVKADPGVFLVYCGFLALIISVFFSYTSYFQIWAVKREKSVYVYANTNRAVYFFEKHVLDLLVRLEHEGSEAREKYPILK